MRFIDQFQQIHNDFLLAAPNSQIRQTFLSTHDNLSGIRVSLSNANLGGNKLYQISIMDNAAPVRSEEVSESNIGWDMTLRYDFKPIEGSKNRIYALEISSLDKSDINPAVIWVNERNAGLRETLPAVPESDLSKKYLQVMYNRKDEYKAGSAFLNEKPLSGDIAFETYYSAGTTNAINGAFRKIYSNMRQDYMFTAFYLLLIFGLLAVIWRSLRRSLLHFPKSRKIGTARR